MAPGAAEKYPALQFVQGDDKPNAADDVPAGQSEQACTAEP